MAASLSGALLSSLFYEHSNRQGDQEGLLLGKIVSHVTDTISDSQLNNVKTETVTYVSNFIACEGLFSWYDGTGSVGEQKLKEILSGYHKQDVVGWYKFRRQSTMRPSLREQAVHHHLKAAFPGVPAQNFLLALFTSSTTSNMSTHSFDFTFAFHNGRMFQNLPIRVSNLEDTSHTEYKSHTETAVMPEQGIYAKTVQKYRPHFLKGGQKLEQVQQIHSLNSQLNSQLLEMCGQVAASESKVGALVDDVQKLRKLLNKNRRETSKAEPPSRSKSDSDVVSELGSRVIPRSSTGSYPRDPVNKHTPSSTIKQSQPPIHDDLLNLVIEPTEPISDPITVTSRSESIKVDRRSEEREQAPILVPEKVNGNIEKPTSLPLSDSVESADNEDTVIESKRSADPFDFVADIVKKAKSPEEKDTGDKNKKPQKVVLVTKNKTLNSGTGKSRSADIKQQTTQQRPTRTAVQKTAAQSVPPRSGSRERLRSKAKAMEVKDNEKTLSSSPDY